MTHFTFQDALMSIYLSVLDNAAHSISWCIRTQVLSWFQKMSGINSLLYHFF